MFEHQCIKNINFLSVYIVLGQILMRKLKGCGAGTFPFRTSTNRSASKLYSKAKKAYSTGKAWLTLKMKRINMVEKELTQTNLNSCMR